MESVSIRRVSSDTPSVQGVYREMVGIQRRAFGFDELEVVPPHVLGVAAGDSGLLLGAWIGQSLLGFALCFLNAHSLSKSGGLFLHLLAVVPEYQSTGIGRALMEELFRQAASCGFTQIIWYSDPMLSRNSYFYIRKCGARAVSLSRDH